MLKQFFASLMGSNSSSSQQSVTIINGKEYRGQNISIVNNEVIVDGVSMGKETSPIINITINGDVNELATSNGNVTVNGSAKDVSSTNGEITITGVVSGDVTTTNGDVTCGNVQGKVKTVNGNISHR